MNCLRCGAETKNEQVFCQDCLISMEAYPVKPDIHIQLPNRQSPVTPKKSSRRKRSMTTDEQIALLKKNVHRLTALSLLLALLLSFACAMLVHNSAQQPENNVGKNYTYSRSLD